MVQLLFFPQKKYYTVVVHALCSTSVDPHVPGLRVPAGGPAGGQHHPEVAHSGAPQHVELTRGRAENRQGGEERQSTSKSFCGNTVLQLRASD